MKTTSIRILACAMLATSPIAGGAWAAELDTGIVIRGIGNTMTCKADTVVPYDQQVDGRAHNLSVNCTNATDKIADYATYIGGMVHTKFCVARITKIKQKAGKVRTDPVVGNGNHCLLNNIKAKDLVGVMTPKP